jgi:hypothetical protein
MEETMSSAMRTMAYGKYINNDDLQKHLLKEACAANSIGDEVTAEFLRTLTDQLERLKE